MPATPAIPILDVELCSELDVIRARRYARRIADRLGYSRLDRTRITSAVSEVTRHALAHRTPARLGFAVSRDPPFLEVSISHLDPQPARRALRLDDAPDPEDDESLAIAAACLIMDRCEHDATAHGMTVRLLKRLPDRPAPIDREDLGRLAEELAGGEGEANALDELGRQNQNLLRVIEKLRESDASNRRLAEELEETNRGVMALYADLEANTAQLRHLNETLEQRVAERTAVAERRTEQLRAVALQLNQAEHRERRRIAQTLHDHLQQLLVAGKMHLGLLRRDNPKELHESIDQVAALIDQSIEVSRTLTVELSPPILHQGGLIAAIRWLAERMPEKHGLSVHVATLGEEHDLSEQLKVLLFQAVQELLFNVVKHAHAAEAQVTMDARDTDLLRITVEDDGTGFDLAAISASQSGTGFGLLSVRERLEWLGGRLGVTSQPGRGTRMIVTMPVDLNATPAPAAEPPSPERPQRAEEPAAPRRAAPDDSQAIRVLLVDDHQIVREGLCSIVQAQRDMTVIAEASDGWEAVELVRRLSPHAVVMDINMPRMDGIEATRRITAEYPHVRVIALSMHDAADTARAMRSAGACDYLTKDRASENLCDAIRGQFSVTC